MNHNHNFCIVPASRNPDRQSVSDIADMLGLPENSDLRKAFSYFNDAITGKEHVFPGQILYVPSINGATQEDEVISSLKELNTKILNSGIGWLYGKFHHLTATKVAIEATQIGSEIITTSNLLASEKIHDSLKELHHKVANFKPPNLNTTNKYPTRRSIRSATKINRQTKLARNGYIKDLIERTFSDAQYHMEISSTADPLSRLRFANETGLAWSTMAHDFKAAGMNRANIKKIKSYFDYEIESAKRANAWGKFGFVFGLSTAAAETIGECKLHPWSEECYTSGAENLTSLALGISAEATIGAMTTPFLVSAVCNVLLDPFIGPAGFAVCEISVEVATGVFYQSVANLTSKSAVKASKKFMVKLHA